MYHPININPKSIKKKRTGATLIGTVSTPVVRVPTETKGRNFFMLKTIIKANVPEKTVAKKAPAFPNFEAKERNIKITKRTIMTGIKMIIFNIALRVVVISSRKKAETV